MGAPDTYQLFPALDPAVEAALRSSIKRFGVLVPIVKDQHGNVLDGHHRQTIADELGVEYRTDRIVVADETEARAIVETLNTDRGHRLKSDMRREVVADLHEGGHSNVVIAKALGVSEGQIRKDLTQLRTSTKLDSPERTIGLDGKSRPAKRPVASKQYRTAPEIPETDLLAEARRARMERREEKRTERRKAIEAIQIAPAAGERFRIVTADFASAEIADASADWVVTDPPYAQEYLDEYDKLGAFSARVLRPGGGLLCMVGQTHLPEMLRRLVGHLDYRWTLAYLTPGGQSAALWQPKINTFWKPVLWLSAGKQERSNWVGDVCRSDPNDNDKHLHHWGQSESGMYDLMRRFVIPGQTIVDPFCGGGTTGVAALQLGCQFVGIEIDPAFANAAAARLGDAA
jgi:ParB-like chromosome segregation protein Spo0J